jgi:hypothetical protein
MLKVILKSEKVIRAFYSISEDAGYHMKKFTW